MSDNNHTKDIITDMRKKGSDNLTYAMALVTLTINVIILKFNEINVNLIVAVFILLLFLSIIQTNYLLCERAYRKIQLNFDEKLGNDVNNYFEKNFFTWIFKLNGEKINKFKLYFTWSIWMYYLPTLAILVYLFIVKIV